jgi:hypothetical protein
VLQRAGMSAVALLAAGLVTNCLGSDEPASQSSESAAAHSGAAITTTPSGLLGFAFNAGSRNLTIFDAASRQPLTTHPLNASIRWLSNEQRFWDGSHIWTYDVWDDVVQAIAIDPRSGNIARVISTAGRGPAHSLMLTPERDRAWLNVAGDDHLAVVDLTAGEVIDRVTTGAYP